MMESNVKRILLVGASGRVGSMVHHHWPRIGGKIEVVPQSRNPRYMAGLTWSPTNGAEPLIEHVRRNGIFDAMIVLAGVTPGKERQYELNTVLAQACLDGALRAGIQRVLIASSSAVYGTGNGEAFREQSPCRPINEYGASKLQMEDACRHFRDSGIDLCFLRIGNIAGADALLTNISNAEKNEAVEIDIFENKLGPVRSYIGAKTFTKVLQTLSLHPDILPEILNIAAPSAISMIDLAAAAQHPWLPRTPANRHSQYITLDCNALEGIHCFDPIDSNPEELIAQWKQVIIT